MGHGTLVTRHTMPIQYLLIAASAAARPAALLVSRRALVRSQPQHTMSVENDERAALLARARERHAQTERALRPPPPPPDDVATQDVAEEAGGPSGPSSFGIPSSRLGWLYVFGPLTLYALLGFAGYGAAVALLGSAALEALKALVQAL